MEMVIGKPHRSGFKVCFSALILQLILAWTGLLAGTPVLAQTPVTSALTEARDLAAEVRQAAANGAPLLILYSRDDCSWCEKLRREYLAPLAHDPAASAMVREVHMDHTTPLIDFQGRRTTSADFARDIKARFAPTIMFHGPGGVALADPIVGFRLADFYGAYLERAIADSRTHLKKLN